MRGRWRQRIDSSKRTVELSLVSALATAGALAQSPQVYVDRYFSEVEVADIDAQAPAPPTPGPPTRFSATYRYYVDSLEGRAALQEHGLEVRWQRETLRYGDLDLDVAQLHTNAADDPDRWSGRYYFSQEAFVVTPAVAMDSELGHLRNTTPPLLAAGYRTYLPGSILEGAHTTLYGNRASLSLTAGRLGRYQGVTANAFDRAAGELYGAGVEYAAGDAWQVAAQWWRTAGAGELSHDVWTAGLQYEAPGRASRHQLRAMGDSAGEAGVWYDGVLRTGQWTHRFGAFHFTPDLRWTDVALENDRQGGYWRADFNSFRWRWTLSTDISRTDVQDDPDVPGGISSRSFVNANWLVRQNLQLGGSWSISTDHPEPGSGLGDRYGTSLQLYANRRWRTMRTRLELQASRRETAGGRNVLLLRGELSQLQARWDQEWLAGSLNRLLTRFEGRWQNDGEHEWRVSVNGYRQLSSAWQVSADAQAVLAEDALGSKNENANLGLGISWRSSGGLFLELSGTYNHTRATAPDRLRTRQNDTTFTLTLGYASSSGLTPVTYGLDTGALGTGSLEGIVFLDADRDGVRDPEDQGAAGITVILDRFFTAVTDAEGRYEFDPVPAGRHELSVVASDAPLPWGLIDESPHEVSVGVRGRLVYDIGFVEIEDATSCCLEE